MLLLRSLNFLNLLLGDNPSPSLADGQSNGAENARDKKNGNARPNRGKNLQSRGASLTMVRASTQQTVDRIVGTAVVVGLSVAFVRWLSRPSSSRSRSRIEGKGKENDVRKRNEEDFRETESQDQIVENNHEEYEHQGSCHCSSIIFVVSSTIANLINLHLKTITAVVGISSANSALNTNFVKQNSFGDRRSYGPSILPEKSGTHTYRPRRTDSNWFVVRVICGFIMRTTTTIPLPLHLIIP